MNANLKVVLLDTNVILLNSKCIYDFTDTDLVIPSSVIAELDNFKKNEGENGYNSREFMRDLDEKSAGQSLKDGIRINETTTLKIMNQSDFINPKDVYADNDIIAIAKNIKQVNPDKNVVICSNDINLRVRASTLGLIAERYEVDCPKEREEKEEYLGYKTFNLTELQIDDDAYLSEHVFTKEINDRYVYLHCTENKKKSSIWKIDYKKGTYDEIKINQTFYKMFNMVPKNIEQIIATDMLLDDEIKLVMIGGKAGSGKAQPLDSKVLTDNGYKNMGDVKIGDFVFSDDGNLTEVLGVYPQGKKDIYEIVFSDGSTTRCCKEHLWYTKNEYERNSKKEHSVKDTEKIIGSLRGHDGRKNHSIPLTCPIKFTNKDTKIDPYLLGVLIGDGCLRNSVSFSSADEEIVNRISEIVKRVDLKINKKKGGYNYSIVNNIRKYGNESEYISYNTKFLCENVFYGKKDLKKNGYDVQSIYASINKDREYKGCKWAYGKTLTNNGLKDELVKLGLFNHLSYEKFIPSEYLYTDIDSRILLLQGIMDTDGTVDKKSHTATLTTTSEMLKNDFMFLVQSLGGVCKVNSRYSTFTHKGVKKKGRLSYNISINIPPEIIPFKLKRKLDLYEENSKYVPTKYIQDIKYVGKEEAQCIYVKNEKHTYLTDNCIVTHNTMISSLCAMHQLVKGKYEVVYLSKNTLPLSKSSDIGFLPGSSQEKLDPYYQSFMDAIRLIKINDTRSGKSEISEEIESAVEYLPFTFIRGRSLHSAICIADEVQNNTIGELKTLITRAGENTKIILLADVDQIDSPYLDKNNNGFAKVIKAFKNQPIAGFIKLMKCERSKLADIASKIL